MSVMGDTEVQSVRGKGWVTFDDSNEAGSNNTTPRKLSQTEETPGSIEVDNIVSSYFTFGSGHLSHIL